MAEAVHSMSMTDRRTMTLTGVTDTERFDEDTIIIYTCAGMMTIKGRGMKVGELSLENGQLSLTGEINSVTYGDRDRTGKTGMLGKLFR
ncbi:MAG: YabP/YqfC family sporulation protein [Oscillospiraceae bacterium]